MNKITLSSDDFEITNFTDEEQVKVQVINAELKQSSWFSTEQRSYMIFNGCQCHQRVQYSKSNKSKYRINLRYLSSDYKHIKHYAYGWFTTALILFLCSLAILTIPNLNQQIHINNAILLFFLSLITLFSAFIMSKNRLVFVSKKGKVPLLEFIYNPPETDDLAKFINILKNKINATENIKPMSSKEYNNKELKELRRLKSEGVISTHSFNKAMLQIIKNHQ